MEPADFAHFADTAAQQFLKELPPLIRERGEAYLRKAACATCAATNRASWSWYL